MNMIVAVDRNWAIGKNNDLLVSIPFDKKFFHVQQLGVGQLLEWRLLWELWPASEVSWSAM